MMNRFIALLVFIIFVACIQTKPKNYTLKEDVVFLSSDSLQGRKTGTQGERIAANYIAKRFQKMYLEAKGTHGFYQDFSFKNTSDPHQEIEFIKATDSTITGRNVIGFINNKAKNTIVIGAHYDHLGFGGSGSLHRGDKAIHNGADDNASGIAVMLHLAKKLMQGNINNNYLFIAFSGEEMGLLGSNYFVKHPTIDISTINYMINMDMVGRLKGDSTLAVYGTGTSPMFKQVLNAHNSNFKLVTKESGVGPSDHTSFYLQNIPVLHFFTGQHEDYHKPTDDAEKLNYKGMQTISNYIFNIISDLDDNSKLTFRKTKNESDNTPKFKVGLGVIPDYLFDGKGMRIDGISPDKPAEKAGLQKGDIVVKLGDNIVTNMVSYMKALSVFDKGNTTKVVVKRKDTELTVTVTF